jgi:hypothetical protein
MDRTHAMLLVEPAGATADALAALVRPLGFSSSPVDTLEEAVVRARGAACCVVLGPRAALGAPGGAAFAALRAVDPRRNADDHHVLPILFVGEPGAAASFVSQMHKLGADGFLASAEARVARDAIRQHLREAGRERHERCARLCPPPPAHEGPPPPMPAEVRLELTAQRVKKRTVVLVDGAPVPLPEREFVVLLILAAKRLSGRAALATRTELRISQSRDVLVRLRRALRPVMRGAAMLESDFAGRYRLATEVNAAAIPWSALGHHGSFAVRELVRKYRDD